MRRWKKLKLFQLLMLIVICASLWLYYVRYRNVGKKIVTVRNITAVKFSFEDKRDYNVIDNTRSYNLHNDKVIMKALNAAAANTNQSTSFMDDPQSRGLVIMTSMRTGSSFTGQLFNQNPDVFYFFEPLFPLQDRCDVNLQEKISTLVSALTCKMDKIVELIDHSLSEAKILFHKSSDDSHLKRRITNLMKCKQSSMCFRSSTKALCTKDLCPFANTCSKCNKHPTVGQIEMKCNNAHLRVIKTVRACHLDHLTSVRAKVGTSFKIIHLVRDPRATALSRLRMHFGRGNITKEMKVNCEFDASNLEAFKNRRSNLNNKWLQGNYMVVRYEDILTDPKTVLKQMSAFLNSGVSTNLNFEHKDVLEWLRKNTQATGNGMYSTKRNITQQATKWRGDTNLTMVLDIQSVCGHMMDLFGYHKVKTIIDLLDTSVDLFQDIPNYYN
ncbi:carbohydrate sulfotransferase 3 [Ciona intestinalis]